MGGESSNKDDTAVGKPATAPVAQVSDKTAVVKIENKPNPDGSSIANPAIASAVTASVIKVDLAKSLADLVTKGIDPVTMFASFQKVKEMLSGNAITKTAMLDPNTSPVVVAQSGSIPLDPSKKRDGNSIA